MRRQAVVQMHNKNPTYSTKVQLKCMTNKKAYYAKVATNIHNRYQPVIYIFYYKFNKFWIHIDFHDFENKVGPGNTVGPPIQTYMYIWRFFCSLLTVCGGRARILKACRWACRLAGPRAPQRCPRAPQSSSPEIYVDIIPVAEQAIRSLVVVGLHKKNDLEKTFFEVWTGGWPVVQLLRKLFVQRCRNTR